MNKKQIWKNIFENFFKLKLNGNEENLRDYYKN